MPIPSGYEIAARAGLPVEIGLVNCYDFVARKITLTADVYLGRDPVSVLIAAHELRHTQQPMRWHLFRFIPWIRDREERDAWEFAAQFLAGVLGRD